MTKIERRFLLLALGLAVGLRLIGINSREIQYDDAFSVFLARQNFGNIIQGTAADTMPPLYYFLLHFWQQLSSDLGFLRLLSVILSLVGWMIAVDLCRRMFGSKTAVIAGFLLAFSPLQLYHSQDIRMYALLMSGQLAYYWFFYRIFEENNSETKLWIGLIISGIIAMYSHALAGFGLILGNLFLLWKKRWQDQIRLIRAQLWIGAAYLPWAIYLPGQIAKVQHAFWTPRPGLVEVFQSVILLHASLPLKGVLFPIAAILSAQIFIVVLWEMWKNRRKDSHLDLIGVLLLGLPFLLFVISYVVQPVFVTRAFIFSVVMYCIAAARIIVLRWNRGIGAFLLGGFLLTAILSLPSFYTFNEFPRSPFRDAVKFLNLPQNRELFVLHDNKLSYFPMRYYDENREAAFLADEPGSPNDTFAPASQKAMGIYPLDDWLSTVTEKERFFFVVFRKAINEFENHGQRHPVLTTLSNRFQEINHTSIGDLEIYEFRISP